MPPPPCSPVIPSFHTHSPSRPGCYTTPSSRIFTGNVCVTFPVLFEYLESTTSPSVPRSWILAASTTDPFGSSTSKHGVSAQPHVDIPVKNYLENSGWEVLPQPPYSPDLALSDYHLFRSMQNVLTGIRFTSNRVSKIGQAGAVLLGWNPQIARKMEKSHSFRWAII